MSGDSHEKLTGSHKVQRGTNRSFGLVFSVVFVVVGLAPLYSGGLVRVWALGVATGFLVVTLIRPQMLEPLNLVWFKFGLLLNKIVSPIVMGLMFYVVFTPMGLGMRLMGKDPMKLKRDEDAKTYWLDRDPPGPSPESLKNQF